ncbi:hypothetical protein PSYMO_37521, partial [Pseudomonas amygdali pv. mori str. 301020]
MVNRVHGNTTNGWANATPAFLFAILLIVVFAGGSYL